ncbi:MAG: response regulator transcription factor, partial [Clostridiales bacterium]|nr:response regulator transcription factor [Clostridiales bacterium]
YIIEEAYDGQEAVEKFQSQDFDLVILDVMLPGLDGFLVLQRIREKSTVPVIMLTAKGEDMDKILGLEYGADDYITKPFNILELKARIKAIFRRANNVEDRNKDQTIKVGKMTINIANRSVLIDGKDVNLTAKEFDLLQLFATNPGKVYSREQLLETVWKYDYLGDLRTVDVHIRRLREKIEPNPSQPEYIFTKWGVGYYFVDK